MVLEYMCWNHWYVFPSIMFFVMIMFLIVMLRRRKYTAGRMGFCGPWSYYRNTGRYKANFNETVDEILKKRYARGEINKEEYERMKKDIEM